MERENEMIVISHRLKFESREEWLETRDKTRRHQTSDFYPPIFGHRPIYIRGEAATFIPNSSFKFVIMGQHAPRANPEPQYNYFSSNIV